jgi:methylenetetrahydrofolate reductase (NADPH)
MTVHSGATAISVAAISESRRASASPMFAGLSGDIGVSFEFFPPKTDKMNEILWASIEMLAPLGPRFVSVTYGAGGTTRERTHATVARIASETGIPAAAHLTCVDASKAQIAEVAHAYWDAGVRHIVALRGDPPVAGTRFVPHPDGYTGAADLVAGLSALHPFEISVGAYPETHPEADCAQSDLDHLKRKLDAGATRAITQFFHEPDTFFRFRDAAAAAGIGAEIVPGIMPVTNFTSVARMSAMCGTQVPDWLARLFDGLDDLPAARQLVAGTVAAELCRRLYAGGVRDFHFYTLNRAELAYAICHMLGLRAPATPKDQAA